MALDKDDLLDKFIDKNKFWHNEGETGVNNFKKIIKVIGYDSIEEFLGDNPDAIMSLQEFISGEIEANANWEQAFREEVVEQMPRNEVLDKLVESVDQLDQDELLEAAKAHWREKYNKMSDSDLETEYSSIFDDDITIPKE